jgi:hypothetical protein
MNSNADPFDKTSFLRTLRHASIELYRSMRAAEANAADKKRLVENLFGLIKDAKRQAFGMAPDEKAAFLGHVDKITKLSGVPLGLDPPVEAPPAADKPKFKPGGDKFSIEIDVSDRRRVVHKAKEGDPTWRMINLAIRNEEGAVRRVIGIAEKGEDYYIFDGEMGDAYQVVQTQGIRDAREIFSKALSRGYREISPGSYVAVRLGAFPAA